MLTTTLLIALLNISFLALELLQASQIAEDFNDLGNLLLGGFAAAIVVALGFVFIKLKLRDRKPPAAQFISISAEKEK